MNVVNRIEAPGASSGLFGWFVDGTPAARRGLLAASLGLLLFALLPVRALRDSEHLVGLAHDDHGMGSPAGTAQPEAGPEPR